jgi:hypothetical protein
MRLTEEQKIVKEGLKLEHRDRLVALGLAAVEHAAKGLAPTDTTGRAIYERLKSELCELGKSQKYVNGIILDSILSTAHHLLYDKEHIDEIVWQVINIDPKIQASFRTLLDAENQLKNPKTLKI